MSRDQKEDNVRNFNMGLKIVQSRRGFKGGVHKSFTNISCLYYALRESRQLTDTKQQYF